MENQRKKISTSKTRSKSTGGRDHTKATKPELPSWSQLPATFVTGIYQYLGDVDRVSMAMVCKPWEQSFNYPTLWRTRSFEFRGRRGMQNISMDEIHFKPLTGVPVSSGKSAIRFARRFPTYLQDVGIFFHPGIYGRILSEVVKDFTKFVELLHDAKLTKLGLFFYGFRYAEGERRGNLIDAVCRLIKEKGNLKVFVIGLTHFELNTGVTVLRCLAEASGNTVEMLCLHTFFAKHLAVYQEERVFTEMQKFTSLSDICVEYSILSDELVTLWSKGCPSLSSMTLLANRQGQSRHAIGNEAWKALVRTHPQLLVQLHVESNLDTIPLAILSPAMPLNMLRWDVGFRFHTVLELTSLLRRVANYHKTLESIYVEIYLELGNVDTVSLLNILSNCSKLPPLRFENRRGSLYFWTLSQEEL